MLFSYMAVFGHIKNVKSLIHKYKQLYMAENGHIKGGSNLIWPFFKQNCGVQNHYMAVLNIKLGGLKLGRGMSKSNRIPTLMACIHFFAEISQKM